MIFHKLTNTCVFTNSELITINPTTLNVHDFVQNEIKIIKEKKHPVKIFPRIHSILGRFCSIFVIMPEPRPSRELHRAPEDTKRKITISTRSGHEVGPQGPKSADLRTQARADTGGGNQGSLINRKPLIIIEGSWSCGPWCNYPFMTHYKKRGIKYPLNCSHYHR